MHVQMINGQRGNTKIDVAIQKLLLYFGLMDHLKKPEFNLRMIR